LLYFRIEPSQQAA